MSTPRLKVLVYAHHNVEDFRPYHIPMTNKGSANANLVHAFKLAIKREAEWSNWFDEYNELEGTTLTAIVKEIETALNVGKQEIVVPTYERVEESAEVVEREDGYKFNVWFEKDNFGFGFGKIDEQGKVNTDKYENKWIEIA